MKHVHYDKVAAKNDNMNLVVFVKCGDEWKVQLCNDDQLNFSGGNEYFLCLPQHNEDGQCIHWLNGGKLEVLEARKWQDVDSVDECSSCWYGHHFFMRDYIEFRIKPKKVKRWIVYRNVNVYGPYLSPDDINDDFKRTGQLLEIEIEI